MCYGASQGIYVGYYTMLSSPNSLLPLGSGMRSPKQNFLCQQGALEKENFSALCSSGLPQHGFFNYGTSLLHRSIYVTLQQCSTRRSGVTRRITDTASAESPPFPPECGTLCHSGPLVWDQATCNS